MTSTPISVTSSLCVTQERLDFHTKNDSSASFHGCCVDTNEKTREEPLAQCLNPHTPAVTTAICSPTPSSCACMKFFENCCSRAVSSWLLQGSSSTEVYILKTKSWDMHRYYCLTSFKIPFFSL